jgi:hypothetical protein
VLRGIFGRKKDELVRDERKLHNEELHNLHFSPKIIRRVKPRKMKRARYLALTRQKTNKYRILMRKPRIKELTGKT